MSLLAPPPPGTLDYETELERQSAPVQEAARKVREFLASYHVDGDLPLRPASLTYRSAEDRQNYKNWSGVIHALSPIEQQRMPAHLRLMARAAWAFGEFQAAQRDFHNLGEALKDPEAKAEAFHQAYRAALERPQLGDALYELKFTLTNDARRFAPLPLDRFEPDKLLIADGFGLLARCKLRGTDAAACVRTVNTAELERDADALLHDLERLKSLGHPNVVKIGGAEVDPEDPQRLLLLVEYLEGQTLEQFAGRHGVMPLRDVLSVAKQIGQGLEACHAQGIVHRAIRPSAIQLQRRKEGGYTATLNEFGLNYPKESLRQGASQVTTLVRTMAGRSLVSAADYAAPEQTGRILAEVGPATDIYSFAKTLCFALFNTPHPAANHWLNLNEGLGTLLHACLQEEPAQRPSAAEVSAQLAALVPQGPPAPALPPDGKDPKLQTSVAPPPGVGQVFEPKRGAGIASRKRLTPVEILRIRLQRLTLLYGLIGLGIVAVLAITYVVFFYRPGREEAKVAPARGVLLCQGLPVADAKVIFVPESRDGEIARGTTNAKGEFVLTSLFPNDGAFPGTYKVVIEKESKVVQLPLPVDPRNPLAGGRPGPVMQIPEVHYNYGRESSTPLRYSIPKEGDTNITLQLNILGR